MAPTTAERLQSLFASASELTEDERAAFLARECVDDPQMLSELRALLDMDRELAYKTIRPIAPDLSQLLSTIAPAESLVGLRVGAFELRDELGRGGMGSVYRAERVDGTVAQQAAIKFVRRELLDATTLRRFQIERQTLASLDHPNIAHLLDAGELANGTPYFVMEYVAGVPITDYCAQANLGVRERVELFRLVCAAVMQAHRGLVVHRDLKPSNILVTAQGAPKLLDFGIAKPLNADFNIAAEEQTGTAQRYFSPMYSTPEQLLGGPIGVGCDVYALGLLLYELLAGTRPFDFTGLSSGQIERLVTTVPPNAPSAAAAKTNAASPLQRQLRGDLDGIVLRCLRKAPNERYASVEQLDADLSNYLEGRPVQARGGHGWYRAQKFLRRNRFAVAAVILIALSLIAGAVSFAWQARIAEQRAAELAQVAKFHADMLGQIDTTQAGILLSKDINAIYAKALLDSGAPETERVALATDFSNEWRRVNTTDAARNLIDSTVLKPALKALDEQFANQPLVDATLRQSLADLYRKLGLFDAALPPQERALAIRRERLTDNEPDLLTSIAGMGVLMRRRGEFESSEALLREALAARRRVLGDDHQSTLISYNNLATVLWQQGEYAEAGLLFREAMTRGRRVLGDDHIDTLTAINGLSLTLSDRDDLSEAEPYVREVFERATRTMDENNPFRLQSISNMGSLLQHMGRLEEAEPLLKESADTERRLLGEDHPDSAFSAFLFGGLLLQLGKEEEAEPYLRQSLEARRHRLGNNHPQTTNSIINVGLVQMELGRFAEAEKALREAAATSLKNYGPDDPNTIVAGMFLGDLLVATGRYAEAIGVIETIEPAVRQQFTGRSSFNVANTLAFLGRAELGAGHYAAAETHLVEAHQIYTAADQPHPKRLRRCLQSLVDLYTNWQSKEPGKGYSEKTAHWKLKLDDHNSTRPMPLAPRDSVDAKI